MEWRAPAVIGQVCRLWRQIVLNAPRVWAYIEIDHEKRPSIGELRSWLRRSGTASLHTRVYRDFTFDTDINKRALYDILSEYHSRIASLRMSILGTPTLFMGRVFPCMRLLDIEHWDWKRHSIPLAQWGPIPRLQSLRLSATEFPVVPLDDFPPLEELTLHRTHCNSFLRHSPSLTTLMLHDIVLGDVDSIPVTFPSLTFLSLNNVYGLKPHIHTPYLAGYHEGGFTSTPNEIFPSPLLSLVEYGVSSTLCHGSDLTEWHRSFPNVLRLSLRSHPSILIPLLDSLSGHPHLLPGLQKISVGQENESLNEEHQEIMMSLVRVRSEASHMDVALYFEMGWRFHIPLFFGSVSHDLIK